MSNQIPQSIPNNITDKVLSSEDATVVHVDLDLGFGQKFHSVGTAKRHPKDRPALDIGELLAYSRALKKIAEWAESQANMMIGLNCEHHQQVEPNYPYLGDDFETGRANMRVQ